MRQHRQSAGWKIALVAGLAFAACETRAVPVDLEVSASSLQRSFKQHFARYRLADGAEIFVDQPRDFGEAICGPNICVHKADIRRIHLVELQRSLSPEKLVAAPVVALALAGTIQSGGGGGGSGPTVADLMPACANHTDPAPSPSALASTRALAEWAWSNQASVGGACLQLASTEFAKFDEARSVRLRMLATAKTSWILARCRNAVVGISRVTPAWFSTSGVSPGTRGDPQWLAWAREIIADPATYDDPLSPEACLNSHGGLAPEQEWPERRQLLAARLDPFSRDPFVAFGEAQLAPNSDPHPMHNRATPALRRP